jgi:hypothetical protein
LAATAGFDFADTAVGVRRELLLVPFEFGPVDIAFMMILEHDLPFLERLSVSVSLLRTDSGSASTRNVISVLKNPFYAGAYIYRKSEHRTAIVNGPREDETDRLLSRM